MEGLERLGEMALADVGVAIRRGDVGMAKHFLDHTQICQSLGIAIVGGLIFSQIMTLYLTPVVYTYIEGLHARLTHKKKEDQPTPKTQEETE